MSISFFTEEIDLPVLHYEIVEKLLKSEIRISKGRLGTINYIFCRDEYLLDMNIKFLGHDYYTDVITFDYSSGKLIAGDVYISVDRVENNSVTFSQNLDQELVRVISHGLLHLLGFKDKEEEEIVLMRSKEESMLSKYNFLLSTEVKK